MKYIRSQKFFITILILALSLSIYSCKESTDSSTEPIQAETIKVGALLSITGNWSSLGITSKSAMDFAISDINAYLISVGSRFRFALDSYDTELDTLKAIQFIAQAKAENKKFVIGPQSSAELGAIKKYLDDNNIIAISHGSTAGNLAIAGDNIYRFCPADSLEGAAVAATIYESGIRGLVTICRDDAGNRGLQNSVFAAFTNNGGNTINLTPYGINVVDFTSQIQQIKTAVATLTAQHGTGKVGVYIASFDECTNLFKLAINEADLNSIKWFGSDGVVNSAALVADTIAASFAEMTGYFAPTFGLPEIASSKWKPLSEKIKTQTGIDPDAFALAAYDALWVITSTILATNGNVSDISKLKSVFEHNANSYYGVTGQTQLNIYGDRSVGVFDYWGIVKINGTYRWQLVGKSK